MSPVTIFDVADWFLSKESMSHKKLQKLCYYFKAWGLALYDKDLLPGYEFEAWVHGPVNPDLYQKYKEYGWRDIDQKKDSSSDFNPDELNILESVWITYGDKSANELEAFVHTEWPWREARGTLGEWDPCSTNLSHKTMHDFYLEEYRQYQGV